jgi:hypothetical protein
VTLLRRVEGLGSLLLIRVRVPIIMLHFSVKYSSSIVSRSTRTEGTEVHCKITVRIVGIRNPVIVSLVARRRVGIDIGPFERG